MKNFFKKMTLVAMVVMTMSVSRVAFAAPSVATLDATGISSTGATLNGSVSSYDGEDVGVFFEYDTNQANLGGNTLGDTDVINKGVGSSPAFSATLSGLQPNTTYYYRAWIMWGDVSNPNTAPSSSIKSFKTLASGGGTGCTINSLTANPTNISTGQTSTISWTTQNCNGITLYNTATGYTYQTYGSAVNAGSVTRQFNTSGTYTFTLVAQNTNTGTVSQRTVTITVTTTSVGVRWNTLPNDLPLVRSKKAGSSVGYSVTTSNINPGDVVNVVLYFHNTGDQLGTNTTFRLTPQTTTNGTTHVLSGTLTGGGVSATPGSTTIYTTQPVTLSYIPNSARLYGNDGTSVAPPRVIPGGQTGIEVFGSGINIGDIPGMTTCSTSTPPYNFCHQGTLVLQFQVSSGASTTQCANGRDDDGDGLIDTDDPGCTTAADNDEYNPPAAVCKIDTFYPGVNPVASGSTTTLYWTTTNCTEAKIDGYPYQVDGSGVFGPLTQTRNYTLTATGVSSTDTKTIVVNVTPGTTPPPLSACSNGIDDDNDGRIDYPSDTGCTSPTDTDEYNPQTTYECSDGIDNDGNGRIDYPNDLGCTSSTDTDEAGYVVPQCSITSAYASPNTVTSGSTTQLYWTTQNCTSLNVDGIQYSVNSNGTFGPLYSGKTYVITAYGSNGSDTENVYVGVNTVPVQTYQCNDGYDNDGDGRIDSNDIGCTSTTDNDEYNYIAPVVNQSVFTSSATNVTQTSARLNGILTQYSGSPTQVYFEWGPSASLGSTTISQSLNATNGFFDTLTTLAPNVTYYYRAVAVSNGNTSRGDIMTFRSAGIPVVVNPGNVTIVRPTTTTTTVVKEERGVGLGSNLVTFRAENRTGNACVGENVEFYISYKNISEKPLTDAVIQVALPKDLTFTGSSAGVYNNVDHTLTVNVGILNPNQDQSLTVRGIVKESARDRDLLVANATMSFTNPYTNATESAVTYGLINTNECNRDTTSNLTGLALFGGFLPGSLLGWLLFILLILALILIAREIFRREKIYMMHHSGADPYNQRYKGR